MSFLTLALEIASLAILVIASDLFPHTGASNVERSITNHAVRIGADFATLVHNHLERRCAENTPYMLRSYRTCLKEH